MEPDGEGSVSLRLTVWLLALTTGVAAETRDARTVAVLDEAMQRLADPSSDYRGVLQRALPSLASAAAAEVGAFLGRLPPDGAGFRCDGEFFRRRARHVLRRVRETVQGETPARMQPAVCFASPFAVDVTQPPAAVDIYGFDFDTTPLQLVLVRSDGFEDVTAALVRESHWHLVLKLGRLPISPKSRSLGVAWGHLIRHSIPLVQADARLCSSRLETVAGKTISSSGAAFVELDYEDNKLDATVCVSGGACNVEFLYTTDPDRVIEAIAGATTASYPGPGPVRLAPITVVSTDDGGCISPIAYLEAKRTTALGASARRTLDRELRKVAPAILRLRPRFAPREK